MKQHGKLEMSGEEEGGRDGGMEGSREGEGRTRVGEEGEGGLGEEARRRG